MSTNTEPKHWQPYQVKLIDGKPVAFRDVVVHTILVSDSEDPDLAVAAPIWEWQESAAGKFVMKNAVGKPYWHSAFDHATYGHQYRIVARLSEQTETFWRLKYAESNS